MNHHDAGKCEVPSSLHVTWWKPMDRIILFTGVALLVLGGCFLIVQSINSSLTGVHHGEYLWLALGALTTGSAPRVKREKDKQLGALRQ